MTFNTPDCPPVGNRFGQEQCPGSFQRWLKKYRFGLLALLLFTSMGLYPVSVKAEGICPDQLGEAIAPIVHDPQFRRAHWGILVQTLEPHLSPTTLYAYDAEQYFTPASNVKLLTTAAVLTRLEPQFQILTSVYHLTTQSGQQVLRIVGRGDPSLTEIELRQLVQQIAAQGISRIDLLLLDNQYFQGDPINSTWEWEDIQAGYGAAATSLMLNQNAIGLTLVPQALGEPLQVIWDQPTVGQSWQIANRTRTVRVDEAEALQVGRSFDQPILQIDGQLRVGSASEPVTISIPQPVPYFAEQFQRVLEEEGIRVIQVEMATGALPTDSTEVAAIASPLLAELLIETNQQSNNLYAEALLRILGKTQPVSGRS
ncbi:MAG: D-alanyl-D-alanine carboxypeptidase/D-alanyl-D-alanine-endopeptidase [Leptolyngbyaceae cyanobacterium CRU_2_3]|nr:D-alanyl-D-alanine carboxypeptidase/D-alanyl-D-alanine-endopeptidase [Leptolyngbyaceae cyanobacterium CRU_2_3]